MILIIVQLSLKKEKKNNAFYVVSIGQNKYKINSSNNATIHAEEDAINKLPPIKRSNRLEDVNLVVIRTTKTGILGNSAPCVHCLKYMKDNAVARGYRIKKIYFTNIYGEIECHNLNSLIASNNLHISAYYKVRNYNMKKWFKWRAMILKTMSEIY